MSASKIFSFLFGILGTAMMLLTVILSLNSLDGKVQMSEIPAEAEVCTEQLMISLADGDYMRAEELMYGDSRLGDPREADTELGKKVWRAFADSFTYDFTTGCYGSDMGLRRDVVITTLDIPSVFDTVNQRAEDLLALKEKEAKEAENMGLVYHDGVILDEVMNEIVETAVVEALAADAKTRTAKVTLDLVNEDGTWQIVPSAELLKAVSGGL